MKLHFLARYGDVESAPKRTYKHAKISKIFRGDTPDPRIKMGGRGEDRGEGKYWVGSGKEGIGVWPTQKLSRGAPYAW
jgi:hypothetical protein